MATAQELLHRAVASRPGDSCVFVLVIATHVPGDAVAAFERILSPEERFRASRFQFDLHRGSFIVTRGTLRLLLGWQLGIPPGTVCFRYGANGKPRLDHGGELQFNVSHSGDAASFAFTSGSNIGVDIERIRPMPDLAEVAVRFFCRASRSASFTSS
jgi:4'-phosphopantetheinyl transferase